MPRRPHRALRIVLGFFSLLSAAGSLVTIYGGKPLMISLFLCPPESEVSTLLLRLTKNMGGMLRLFSVHLFFAAREPVRNVAILDGVIVGLCVLALTPCCLFTRWIIRRLYPAYLIWLRSVVPVGGGGGALLPSTARGYFRAGLENALSVSNLKAF